MRANFAAKAMLLLLVFAMVTSGLTAEIRSDDTVRIGETDTLSSDLIAASQTLEVLGRIEGDVFTAGEYLTVEGAIAATLTAAFQSMPRSLFDVFRNTGNETNLTFV